MLLLNSSNVNHCMESELIYCPVTDQLTDYSYVLSEFPETGREVVPSNIGVRAIFCQGGR